MLKELIKIFILIVLVLSYSKSFAIENNVFTSDDKVLDSSVLSSANEINYPLIPKTLSHLCDWMKNNIKYLDDKKRWGKEYWQTAEETLYYKTGDCEDFSTLFCAILQHWGYKSSIINYVWIDPKSKWLEGHSVCLVEYMEKLVIIDNRCTPKVLPDVSCYDEIVNLLEPEWKIYEIYKNKEVRLIRRIKGT